VPRLRAALADDWRRLLPGRARRRSGAEITVGSGATELLHDAIMATVNPGDEVIVFEPAYDAVRARRRDGGRRGARVPLAPPDWRFDPDRLAAAFGPRTRALILNTPHNPTGKVFARAELESIAALCRRHDALVISDEVYARSCSTAPRTSRSRRCPRCSNARSRSAAWARRSASPAGRSAGRSRPRR
jgi:aminotransferase